jgi:MOSC domain-containing protein YiiM
VTAAGAALRTSGALPVQGSGRVAQLNASGGGVPKTPIEAADVDFSGVVGDRQGNRTHHGRPWQALCLWSSEVIAAFAAQGHPLTAGAAGENITTEGLDWRTMRAGLRLRIGTVLAETTTWAVPCTHNARWFANGDFDLMHHENGAVSRIYAFVVEPGRITTGDAICLEP